MIMGKRWWPIISKRRIKCDGLKLAKSSHSGPSPLPILRPVYEIIGDEISSTTVIETSGASNRM